MPGNSEDSRITRRDLWKVLTRYIMAFQWSWNYERMQALGFAWSMMPVLTKLNETNEKLKSAIKRHLNFYNTYPPIGAAILGAVVALEEQEASEDAIDGLKVGLMGPFAGIGDTLFGVLCRPIVGVVAASLALAGSMGGVWLLILMGLFWGVVVTIVTFWAGYNRGTEIVTEAGRNLSNITEGATIMGLTVIGGFIPSILSKISTPLTFTKKVVVEGNIVEKTVEVQSVLDQILPYLIPIMIVALCYWLLKKMKWSPAKVILVLVAIAFAGSLLGVL